MLHRCNSQQPTPAHSADAAAIITANIDHLMVTEDGHSSWVPSQQWWEGRMTECKRCSRYEVSFGHLAPKPVTAMGSVRPAETETTPKLNLIPVLEPKLKPELKFGRPLPQNMLTEPLFIIFNKIILSFFTSFFTINSTFSWQNYIL